MKQRFLLLITALMLCMGARAATVQVIDGLKYIIYTDQNCATLTGMNYTQSEIVIPAEITWEGKKYPVTELGNSCFKDCQNLKSITIPSSVTSIGDYCFRGCYKLTSITIPSSVTSLEEGCFENCQSLASVTIPSSVTSLGSFCFWNCSGLTSITIPSSVTSLGDRCFENCSGLTSITIPSSVTSIGDRCFYNCSGLTSITIPSSVTSLGETCFYNCSGLTSIIIPSSVTSLGDWCFYNCYKLASITIPSSVTSLGKECFENCYSLYSVNIQSPKIKIGSECFASTTIIDFTIMATTPPAISEDCFKSCSIDKAKLMVPKASVNSYRSAAVWKTFGTITDTDGGEVAGECDKPSIGYTGGKLKFGCKTPGAEYHCTIKGADECTDALVKDEMSLAARYDISCFATADGYTRSKTATAKLYWISANIETDGIAPATQMRGVVVSTEGGIVTLSGLNENERVTFYNISGIKLGETRALNSQASISATDDIIIARIGSQSIKVKQ